MEDNFKIYRRGLVLKSPKRLLEIVLLLFTFCLFSTVYSEEIEEISLVVGQIKAIPCLSPTRVVISKPEICDIESVSESEIILSPKSTGVTLLFFWDKLGEHSLRIRVASEDLKEIKNRIDKLLEEMGFKKVHTKISETEGKILLLGEIKTEKEKALLDNILGALKAYTIDLIKIKERALVEIDVQVLELTEEASKKLGFTWPGTLKLGELVEVSEGKIGKPFPEIGAGIVTHLTGKWDKLWRISPWSRSNFYLILDALITEGKARVLSRPKLVTLSGKEAKLVVGGEVPIITVGLGTIGAGGATIEYKEYGILLEIRPTVEERNKIHLVLKTQVSDVGEEIKGTYYLAYPFTKRSAQTELYVEDSQTLYIGGLIERKTDEDIKKVPWLADVPVLGAFFRGKSATDEDRELFITLTPTIVSGKEEIIKETGITPTELPEVISPSYEAIPSGLRGYVYNIKRRVLHSVDYPELARQAGLEGIVRLSLHILSDGRLQEVIVKESSGYKLLDNAACQAAKRCSPFSEFPPQIDLKELWIDIPVIFRQD